MAKLLLVIQFSLCYIVASLDLRTCLRLQLTAIYYLFFCSTDMFLISFRLHRILLLLLYRRRSVCCLQNLILVILFYLMFLCVSLPTSVCLTMQFCFFFSNGRQDSEISARLGINLLAVDTPINDLNCFCVFGWSRF